MPKQIVDNLNIGEALHQWSVNEYESHERTPFWFIGIMGIGIALVIYGMFSGNFLFSLIIILAAIILFLQSHQKANEVDFQITELGVVVGAKFYSYSELGNFYIIYNPPEIKTLYIETNSPVRPIIRVDLMSQNPVSVRSSLRMYLTEDIEKEEEPLSDTFARQWKIH